MIDKTYNPKEIEEPIYDFWNKLDCFNPNTINDIYKSNYCIVMPPPNITGGLHLGHAFQQTIMDILIRYNRMKKKNTLWVMGFDHAGIATQIIIENFFLKNSNIQNTHHIQKKLLEEIWLWKRQSEKFMSYQIKRLGCSVSWKNQRFTMDSEMSFAVKEAFIRLYKDNLIYKGKGLVNWDFKLQTAVSDLEVSYKKIPGSMWYIRYKLLESDLDIINNTQNYLVVATTRPETILGDVAIAVHPDDPRYHKYIGKNVLVPIINRKIPIISDKNVDIKKGTGCVKITPGHDFNDYIIGKKHSLSMINIFSTNRHILTKPEIFDNQGQPNNQLNYCIPNILHNLNCNQARKIIISTCNKLNLLDKINAHNTTIAYNNRTGSIIEPMLTTQWFIRTKILSQPAINAVKQGNIKFIPKKFENIYFQWMNNIQDWCISRQIWWGHQIPAWYDKKNTTYVGHCEKEIRLNYQLSNNEIIFQDNNVLDTWFSSSLWTFSSLGWPKHTTLLKKFHPTDVIISGFDIIFFWIARMIMMTMYFIKDTYKNPQIPFKHIYITGLIRDKSGQKMSKSKENTIDPLNIIDTSAIENLLKTKFFEKKEKQSTFVKNIIDKNKHIPLYNEIKKSYGADSLRLTLASLASPGHNLNWDTNRLIGYNNFCNKLWNVSKFIFLHTSNEYYNIPIHQKELSFSLADRWIISKLNQTIQDFHRHLKNYRFDQIISILYEFIWHQFCDWYIELVKPILYSNTTNILTIKGTRYTLITSLEILLRLSHPIIPFITEQIWQEVKQILKIHDSTIMLQSFPTCDITSIDVHATNNIEWIKNVITEIRTLRIYTGLSSKIQLDIAFCCSSEHKKQCIQEHYNTLIKILKLKSINFLKSNTSNTHRSFKIPLHESELIVFVPEIFNKDIAINRFHKEITLIDHKIDCITKKLHNKNYQNNSKYSFIKEQEKLNFYKKIKNKLINHYNIIMTL